MFISESRNSVCKVLSYLGVQAANSPGELFSSVTFDLESRVSDRLKAKIWAIEYIDFGSLLTVSPEETKYRLSVGMIMTTLVFALSTLNRNEKILPLINGLLPLMYL